MDAAMTAGPAPVSPPIAMISSATWSVRRAATERSAATMDAAPCAVRAPAHKTSAAMGFVNACPPALTRSVETTDVADPAGPARALRPALTACARPARVTGRSAERTDAATCADSAPRSLPTAMTTHVPSTASRTAQASSAATTDVKAHAAAVPDPRTPASRAPASASRIAQMETPVVTMDAEAPVGPVAKGRHAKAVSAYPAHAATRSAEMTGAAMIVVPARGSRPTVMTTNAL